MDILSFVLGYNKGKAQGGGNAPAETDIFPLQTGNGTVSGFAQNPEFFNAYMAESPENFEIKEGETYYVEWDGTTYPCECKSAVLGDAAILYLGNDSMIGGTSKEPFTVGYFVDYGTVGFLTTDDKTTHDIRVYQKAESGADIEIKPLTITENGTYTAPDGEAYSPVTVNIKASEGTSDDSRVKYVTYMYGGKELIKYPCVVGTAAVEVASAGLIDTPTKEPTVDKTYTFGGWSLTDGGAVNNNALKNVTEDRTVYAAFTSKPREYTVTFYDENGEYLTSETIAYGGSSTYQYEKEGYYFNGWDPEPTNITGDLDCYAQLAEIVVEDAEIADDWDTILASVNDGTYKSKYKLGNYKPLDLGSEGIVNMQIAAFDADTLADGSGNTAISFVAKDLLSPSQRINPSLVEIYDYPEVPSWSVSGNTWTSQNRYTTETAGAKWTLVCGSSGKITVSYKTSNNNANYGAMTLYVNDEVLLIDNVQEFSKTYTVTGLAEGDTVEVEAYFSNPTGGNNHGEIAFYNATDIEAEIDTVTTRVLTGYQLGTGAIGGWEHTELRAYLKNTIMPLIPENVRNNIKEVTKFSIGYTTAGDKTEFNSAEDIWIPSWHEISDKTYYELSGPMYTDVYPDDASRVKMTRSSSAGTTWRLRTADSRNGYCAVSPTGNSPMSMMVVAACPIAIGFCI